MEKASGICPKESYPGSLFEEPVEIITNQEKAMKVYKGIQEKISKEDLRRIYRAFNSSLPGKEMELLKYIILGFKLGDKISLYHSDPIVKTVEQAQHKVGREIDRMLGLTRFSALQGGILYAEIQPDHDVLEFIAGHFSDRLKNEPFILHDSGRNKAVIAQGGNWFISRFTEQDFQDMPMLNATETEFRMLWKKYFETIAIKERTNPRCQKNMMPVRYWKNLTEMR
jgi:probable DNA metabolism protein